MIYLLIFGGEFLILFVISRILVRLLARFFLRITGNKSLAQRLFHFIFLPGVVVHELAHLIVAEVLLVRTGGLSFTPEPDEDRLVMGSVGIEKTDPLRRAIIGFAPVFVGMLLISFSVFYFLSDRSILSFPWNFGLVFFVVFEVGNTMFSSRRDLEGTIALLFVILIIVFACYFVGLRLPESTLSFFNSNYFIDIVKKGIWILLFPLIIDWAIILLAKAVNKSA